MKKTAVWILIFLLCAVQGMADGEPKPDNGGFSVKLERLETSKGMASMTLRFENRASQPLRIRLIDPSFNGAPAMFINGWNADEIAVEANGTGEIDISILSDCGNEAPGIVSLRFAADGAVSSPMVVDCEDGSAVTEAAFGPAGREPQLMSDRPIPGKVCASERRILTDRLSGDERARLEYGRAVICLRDAEGGEDRLVRFCALPVVVNDDGSVSADYSGYAVTISVAPDFPLTTFEETRDEGRLFLISRIILTGNAAYYADLAFGVNQAADGSLSLGGYSVSSEELGGVFHSVPLSLFSEFRSANAVLALDDHDGSAKTQSVDDQFISVPLERPLAVEVKPSWELGEIYAYFEYYFTGNRRVAHPPFPL